MRKVTGSTKVKDGSTGSNSVGPGTTVEKLMEFSSGATSVVVRVAAVLISDIG